MSAIEPSTERNRFMTLAEAAKLTPYSKEYLGLLARKGMLSATKIGRNWQVTQEALEEYMEKSGAKSV